MNAEYDEAEHAARYQLVDDFDEKVRSLLPPDQNLEITDRRWRMTMHMLEKEASKLFSEDDQNRIRNTNLINKIVVLNEGTQFPSVAMLKSFCK